MILALTDLGGEVQTPIMPSSLCAYSSLLNSNVNEYITRSNIHNTYFTSKLPQDTCKASQSQCHSMSQAIPSGRNLRSLAQATANSFSPIMSIRPYEYFYRGDFFKSFSKLGYTCYLYEEEEFKKSPLYGSLYAS